MLARGDMELACQRCVGRLEERSPLTRSRVDPDPAIRDALGGSRKVTFPVAPAGTTLGVTDPHSFHVPCTLSPARNNVAGSELSLTTVTFQDRAPGRDGTSRGGYGVGMGCVGVGVGSGVGAGVGRATTAGGSDTPAGTYSSAALTAPSPVVTPPAMRTVPSRSSVADVP